MSFVALPSAKKETLYRMAYEYWREHDCSQQEVSTVFGIGVRTVGKAINKRLELEKGSISEIETSVTEQPHHKETKCSMLLYFSALINHPNRSARMEEELQDLLYWLKRN